MQRIAEINKIAKQQLINKLLNLKKNGIAYSQACVTSERLISLIKSHSMS